MAPQEIHGLFLFLYLSYVVNRILFKQKAQGRCVAARNKNSVKNTCKTSSYTLSKSQRPL
ncbi:hypothetical protein HDF24_05970 [Mucilaginibacter sp. X4EP1]|uniref:hypothetical protein n=1 Tax=Mucilaginibacter sp. X4EP1 TaxID=2723092 RepID=UPI0021686A94|nr:hypothetical protein [Mucilaginibacter sp. X4EP1]MCS3814355.1 hypothetical protein [Mucilaginibacter sp. X4EP1]